MTEDLIPKFEINEVNDSNENKEREFKEVLSMIKTSHNLSTKAICEYLKTYRPWVSKYILPYLDKVYLPNGRNYKENKKKKISIVDWPYLLYNKGIIPSLEASWYCRTDFINILKQNLVSITRRTIAVSRTFLIAPEERDNYKNEYQELSNKRQNHLDNNEWEEVNKINKKLEYLINKYIDASIFDEITNCNATKRTQTKSISVPQCEWNYENLLAVHDLKGYGGIDETIYRKLFSKGAVRLEFNFTSKKNEIGKKIFYFYDPKDKQYDLDDDMPMITLPYDYFVSKILPKYNK